MSDEQAIYEQLAAPIGPLAHLPNNGAAYHTGEQVIAALNRVLGAKWSFHVICSDFEIDSDECWVFGQITAMIGGFAVVKQDYGSQAVKRARSTGKFVSKGEDRKAAATDALKRCARQLGVGLDAWRNEKAPSWRPEGVEEPTPLGVSAGTPAAGPGTSASRAASTPSTSPAGKSSSSTTATSAPLDQLSIETLRDKLRMGVMAATAAQLDPQQLIGMAAFDADLVNFSREQLIEKIRTLGAAILEGSKAT